MDVEKRNRVAKAFWFHVICEVLGMPPDLFLKVRYTFSSMGWRWK